MRLRRSILIVVAAVVALTCVRLGMWQLDRLSGRRDVNAMLEARSTQPVEPIGGLAPAELPYRTVSATGTYEPEHEVILSGRTQADVPGNHVLTPLRLHDGSVVVVDRGWVPLEVDAPPVGGDAAAPRGEVTVTGPALPPDEVTEPPPSTQPSITTRIDLGRADVGSPVLPVYLLLQTQDPPQPSGAPVAATPPMLDEGPHLSYALQWFSFAAIAVIGCAVLFLRERRPARE